MLQSFKNRKQNENIFPRKKVIRFLDQVLTSIKESPCSIAVIDNLI